MSDVNESKISDAEGIDLLVSLLTDSAEKHPNDEDLQFTVECAIHVLRTQQQRIDLLESFKTTIAAFANNIMELCRDGKF